MNNELFSPVRAADISVRDCNLMYGEFHALKNINIEIPAKEITALIGPSGCGKSTFLKIFNRMNDLVPDCRVTGKFLVGGTDIYAKDTDVNLLRRNVGMVFQKPNPFPMSIYENIAFAPKTFGIRRKPEVDEIVERSLVRAGIWDEVKDRLQSSAMRLSIGQQQRLCLARSLAVEPDFILADEATSALDPVSSKTVEDLFVKLKEKYSIIMVTHTLRQALRIADHAVFLYLGEVIETGDAKKVFGSPEEELTRKYLSGVFS